jgi:hypothetical protein
VLKVVLDSESQSLSQAALLRWGSSLEPDVIVRHEPPQFGSRRTDVLWLARAFTIPSRAKEIVPPAIRNSFFTFTVRSLPRTPHFDS